MGDRQIFEIKAIEYCLFDGLENKYLIKKELIISRVSVTASNANNGSSKYAYATASFNWAKLFTENELVNKISLPGMVCRCQNFPLFFTK